ncbi:hypothetical protein EDEG_05099, partial [Edhazardia aedis USNM 41457]
MILEIYKQIEKNIPKMCDENDYIEDLPDYSIYDNFFTYKASQLRSETESNQKKIEAARIGSILKDKMNARVAITGSTFYNTDLRGGDLDLVILTDSKLIEMYDQLVEDLENANNNKEKDINIDINDENCIGFDIEMMEIADCQEFDKNDKENDINPKNTNIESCLILEKHNQHDKNVLISSNKVFKSYLEDKTTKKDDINSNIISKNDLKSNVKVADREKVNNIDKFNSLTIKDNEITFWSTKKENLNRERYFFDPKQANTTNKGNKYRQDQNLKTFKTLNLSQFTIHNALIAKDQLFLNTSVNKPNNSMSTKNDNHTQLNQLNKVHNEKSNKNLDLYFNTVKKSEQNNNLAKIKLDKNKFLPNSKKFIQESTVNTESLQIKLNRDAHDLSKVETKISDISYKIAEEKYETSPSSTYLKKDTNENTYIIKNIESDKIEDQKTRIDHFDIIRISTIQINVGKSDQESIFSIQNEHNN